ncbi:FtsX-like permease family protein [Streptacidiphilus cavernicola]|uniref:FtsX-like permease family protein n=1 Tax=Streptacidiphilus cavernicola TaxID=3342716 RepID=A0ABV6VX20_9ACTN
MIRLGLRLTVGGGREALVRLIIIAAAVALGVGLLLSALAAMNATNTQNDRNAWLNTGRDLTASRSATSTADPVWWKLAADSFQGKVIGRVDVAATGPHAPVPPGIPQLPGPGQFYASPALTELLHSVPADELADRYPGRQIGTIGNAALPGPDSLIVIVGHTPAQLSGDPAADEVNAITTVSPAQCDGPNCSVGIRNSGMVLILSVVSVALIFPVVILIGTATRLAATRREQRFAAMRLVGATPRQVSVVSAAESTVAAVIGAAAGFAVFFGFRPVLARANLTQTSFFTGDLSLTLTDVLLVAVAVPIAAAVSARIALRRVQISPLGVTRRTTPSPPRVWRVVPLVLGLLELGYFIGRRPATVSGQQLAFLPGAFLVVGGIVLAGPWLTMFGARLMARRTGRPAVLIAGRRLSDDPRGGFRAVSGLVLALCVMSATVGVITALVAERGLPPAGAAAGNAVIGDYVRFAPMDRVTFPVGPPSDALLTGLRAIPGVQGVTVIHPDPDYVQPSGAGPGMGGGLASCAQLATMPVFGACPPGATTAKVNRTFSDFGLKQDNWPATWPAADATAAAIATTPVAQIVVATDGSAPAVERARTLLATTYPGQDPPLTVDENRSWNQQTLNGYVQLANVVMMVSFPIAGCSLAVAVAGSLSDRKRPFSLLRLTGVQLGVLRRVVLLESAAPLLIVSVVAIGTGMLAAQLFLKAQLGYSLHAPGGSYYVMVGCGLVAALAVIWSTLPLLRRITGPEVARND